MILRIYTDTLRPADLALVLKKLEQGGIIVYPTDSVYAFGCDAANKGAVEQICMLRNKNKRNPTLSLVCHSISQVQRYAHFSDDVFKLMRRLLPGPYTFILEGNNRVGKLFKNRKTVGVRVPNHPIIQQILEAYGEPLLTASLRTQPDEDIEYMTDPELIAERYEDEVALVLDGGIGGTEASAIIDCTGDTPVVIRGKVEV